MHVDTAWWRDSDFAMRCDDAVFRCGFLAHCAAWHQVPAGSLPDDDVHLAKLLGYGRDILFFRSLRERGALDGWYHCADGRLYHSAMAERVNYALDSKRRQQDRTAAARAARLARNAEPPFRLSQSENRSVTDDVTAPVTGSTRQDNTRPKQENARTATESSLDQSLASEARTNAGCDVVSISESPLSKTGRGDAGGIWSEQRARDDYAANACVPYLPGRTDGERWQIAMAAEDPRDPGHEQACRLMRDAAQRAGVGWVSPSRRARPA